MKKQLSAVALLAGTAIGSGMLSLPLVLAGYGLKLSCVLMVAFVWVAYYSSVIRAELNIYSQADFALKDVGTHYSGKIASYIGSISLKLLSYSLIAAYLCGLASLLNELLAFDARYLIAAIASGTMVLLYFSNSLIQRTNKILFVFLVSAFVLVTVGLLVKSGVSELQVPAGQLLTLNSFALALPIVFTSFGFQGSIHSLTKFVENDRTLIKRACLFGSIIPAVVYTVWTCSVVLIVYNNDAELFSRMINGKVEIAELIACLSHISKLPHLKAMFWVISLLSLLTSIIGVGIAVFDEWNRQLNKAASSAITVIPSALVAIFAPTAFIKILGVSGMILVVLAIFLPVYLYKKMLEQNPEIIVSKRKIIGLVTLTLVGIAVFGAGML